MSTAGRRGSGPPADGVASSAQGLGREGLRREGLRRERSLASPQFRDGRFRNTTGVMPRLSGSAMKVLGEYVFGGQRRVPRAALPLLEPRERWHHAPETGLRLSWLGHSTLLLEVGGVRILTDPVFGRRASPLSFVGPKRFHPVPVPLAGLPALDAVLLSHDHFDHLCAQTVAELGRMGVPFVTSLGVGRHLERLGVAPERITELDWHETACVAGGRVTLTATPAQHFSGRGLRDRNQTLWSSWVIASERHRLFFSGDTGLTEEFRDLGARHGPFDVVMLEVGAWHPAWGSIHLGPQNALRAFELLGGKALLPVHWGTFNLALHAWDEPAETLLAQAPARGIHLLTPRLGGVLEPSRVEHVDPWWREVGSAVPAQERAPAAGQESGA